jgi:hypothetical protein
MLIVIRILVSLAASNAWGQGFQGLPRFEDYPVTKIFTSTPAVPILDTPEKRMFRTRIRDGVAKGVGVTRDGVEQLGPNFAGHYIIVEWQCGSPCGMMAMVDAVNGEVFGLPLSKGLRLPDIGPGDPEGCMQWGYAIVKFRRDRRLMTVEANPDWKEHGNYKQYFVWEGDHWRPLQRVPTCVRYAGVRSLNCTRAARTLTRPQR